MKSKNDTITLHPTFRYWVTRKLFIILIIIFTLLVKAFLETSMATKLFFLALFTALTLHLIYSYINTMFYTSWEVTQEQVKIKNGIVFRTTNYIELYRVFDYEEKKNIVDALLGITNIIIHSGDKSSPTLTMYGIDIKTNIIDIIRERVEIQKQKKSIYEFTNR